MVCHEPEFYEGLVTDIWDFKIRIKLKSSLLRMKVDTTVFKTVLKHAFERCFFSQKNDKTHKSQS